MPLGELRGLHGGDHTTLPGAFYIVSYKIIYQLRLLPFIRKGGVRTRAFLRHNSVAKNCLDRQVGGSLKIGSFIHICGYPFSCERGYTSDR